MYLSETQAHHIIETVSQLSAPKSQLGLDLINAKAVEYGPYKGYFQFGTDTPESFLSHYRWQANVTQPDEPGANFGRYAELPPPPNDVEDMKTFFIKANKIDVS